MRSRIFWILLTGVALVIGIATQERNWLFAWDGDASEVAIERATERSIEARVEQAVERSFDRMQVVGTDGRPVDIAPQTKRELGDAVRRLVAAETELAFMRIRDSSDPAMQQAANRRDAARADVERLKNEIERQEQLSDRDRDVVRQQIRDGIRETIRSAVRG